MEVANPGMKVLGFVNRYSRGVQTVQEELKANPFITYDELMEALHISQNPLYKRIKKLKELKVIERKDGRKKGRWIVKLTKNRK